MAATLDDAALWADFAELGEDIVTANVDEINNRTRILDNEIRVRVKQF